MKVTFKDEALEELFKDGKTSDGRYKKLCDNKKLVNGYLRAVNTMRAVANTSCLKDISFLHYEKLRYVKDGTRSSVRILNGDVRRLIFTENEEGIEVELLEIDDTHYGNKH